MLIDKCHTALINANNCFLERMKDRLHFIDHWIFVPPKLNDLELAEMKEVMQEGEGDN